MNRQSSEADFTAISPAAVPAGACAHRWRLPWTVRSSIVLSACVVVPLAPSESAYAAPPAAQVSDVIQTQDANVDGVVAELTQCRRSEGVLTIKVRFRNTSDKPGKVTFNSWGTSGPDNAKFYVTAGNKKYFMLADSDGTVLSTNNGNGVAADIAPGKTFLWWAKYPAPPAEAKKINFIMPVASPFEDVPITDK